MDERESPAGRFLDSGFLVWALQAARRDFALLSSFRRDWSVGRSVDAMSDIL